MERREALKLTAAILGTTLVGSAGFLSGCTPVRKEALSIPDQDIALLDEIGETILPETAGAGGAKAARIGQFMKVIVEDCYEEQDVRIFLSGIGQLKSRCEDGYGLPFEKLSEDKRLSLLGALDQEAREWTGDRSHYFSMIKELTIWGYFTSQPGATEALRYNPIPGRYDGCIPYDGKSAWS